MWKFVAMQDLGWNLWDEKNLEIFRWFIEGELVYQGWIGAPKVQWNPNWLWAMLYLISYFWRKPKMVSKYATYSSIKDSKPAKQKKLFFCCLGGLPQSNPSLGINIKLKLLSWILESSSNRSNMK